MIHHKYKIDGIAMSHDDVIAFVMNKYPDHACRIEFGKAGATATIAFLLKQHGHDFGYVTEYIKMVKQ